MHFSWRNVRAHDPTDLPAGKYACDAMDQHAASWCGCCFLVAAAQSLEDNMHIALARHLHRTRPPSSLLLTFPWRNNNAPRRPQLSLQTILDHFQMLDAQPGWNACHGGFPLHVFECLQTGACPLKAHASDRAWLGHPRKVHRTPVGDTFEGHRFRLERPRRLHPRDVRSQIVNHGPVVLEIAAQTLKTVDAHGVAVDSRVRDSNHAVAVVGWTTRRGVECWIVRNSWGKRRVPKRVPDDYTTCVDHDGNRCDVEWEAWTGDPQDPGFVLLPMAYPPLTPHDPMHSPWIAVDVVVVA